jgi:hypothetical protein
MIVQRWRFLVPSLFLAALLGCDSTASLYIGQIQFSDLYVMSAVPMTKVTSASGKVQFEPACGGTGASLDGLLFRVQLRRTELGCCHSGDCSGRDFDLGIRPYDRLNLRAVTEKNITPERFDLGITCIEPRIEGGEQCLFPGDCGHGEDARSAETCRPKPGADYDPDSWLDGTSTSGTSYRAFTPSRGVPVGVAVLVDMSGSNKGFVSPSPPYTEVPSEDLDDGDAVFVDFAERASDINGTRMNAVRSIIHELNRDDRLIVFGFREHGIDVICELPDDPDADYATKLDRCFSADKTLVDPLTTFGPLDDYKTHVGGRSPLWTAVWTAQDYLAHHPAAQGVQYKHIVVINDGPDTCTESPNLDRCAGPCADLSTPYDTVRDGVTELEYVDRIPTHFIQYQALGYPNPDPRQQELACLTGGHFLFMNSLDFDAAYLTNVFQVRARLLRHALGGYWELAVEMTGPADLAALPAGRTYGLGGAGTFREFEKTYLGSYDHEFVFEIDSSMLDGRVHVHKGCTADSDCPAAAPAGACATRVWWCDEAGHGCAHALEWADDGPGPTSCDAVEAGIHVQVQALPGPAEANIKQLLLGELPAYCCDGACHPPAPPQLLDALARSGTATCFEYDHARGWVWDSDEEMWWYEATLYLDAEGCSTAIGDVFSALDYGAAGNPHIEELEWPTHWNCMGRQNCFPPPES